MSSKEPLFEHESTLQGERFILPYRTLGGLRHIGWIVSGAALFAILFSFLWISIPLSMFLELVRKGDPFAVVPVLFALLGLAILVPAACILQVGLTVVRNRTRAILETRNGQIRLVEPFMLFRWVRRIPIKDIEKITILSADEESRMQFASLSDSLGDWTAGLQAHCRTGKPKLLVALYPHDLLRGLASQLAPVLDAENQVESLAASDALAQRAPRQPIQVTEETYSPASRDSIDIAQEPPPPPADTKITLDRQDYGFTIRIPPAGLMKGSKGLFAFSLIWNGLVAIFCLFAALAAAGAIEVEGNASPWFILLILLPFVAVGIGTLIASINMGRRSAAIAIAGDRLFLVRESIFGKTTQEWGVEELSHVNVGPSGMEVNNRPVMQLQIHPTNGKKLGCLSQLNNDELAWIASEVARQLGLPTGRESRVSSFPIDAERSDAPPTTASRISQSPAKDSTDLLSGKVGRVHYEPTTTGIVIRVPPKSLLSWFPTLVLGSVVIGFGVFMGPGLNLQGRPNGFGLFDLLFGIIWLLIPTLVGGGLILGSLIFNRRKHRIEVGYETLTIERSGLFGSKRHSWKRSELQSIEVARTTYKVNDQYMYQLRIRPVEGTVVNYLTGRNEDELYTLAKQLTQALSLS